MDNPEFEPDDILDDKPDDSRDDDDIAPPRDFYSQAGREIELTDYTTTNQPGTSTPRLKQQVLKNKIDALYHHIGSKGNID